MGRQGGREEEEEEGVASIDAIVSDATLPASCVCQCVSVCVSVCQCVGTNQLCRLTLIKLQLKLAVSATGGARAAQLIAQL